MLLSRSGHVSTFYQVPCKPRLKVITSAKGKGGPKKGQSALADILKVKEAKALEAIAQPSQFCDPEIRALLLQAASSLWKQHKRYLSESDFDELPSAIFNADFALIMNNCYDEDAHKKPIITYANRAGLQLWGAKSWNDLIGNRCHPGSSDTTESVVEGFQSSVNGQRIKILNPTTFCVEDMAGGRLGQALLFSEYEQGGTKKTVQAYADPNAAQTAPARLPPPSEEDIKAAEDAAQQWATYVRQLKEEQGLTNKDPQVQQAVQAMQQWKARLAALQEALAQELEAAKALFDDDEEEEEEANNKNGSKK